MIKNAPLFISFIARKCLNSQNLYKTFVSLSREHNLTKEEKNNVLEVLNVKLGII